MSAPEDGGNVVQVRTRKGCLTCRKRRRKCDEQKPRCKNCIGRALLCRYGLQLTFLESNSLSLLPEEARALLDTAPRCYRDLKFVDDWEESQSNAGEQSKLVDRQIASEIYSHHPSTTPGNNGGLLLQDSDLFLAQPPRPTPIPSQRSFLENEDERGFSSRDREDSNSIEHVEETHEAVAFTPDTMHSHRISGNSPSERQNSVDYEHNSQKMSSGVLMPMLMMSPNLNPRPDVDYSKNWLPPSKNVSPNSCLNDSDQNSPQHRLLRNNKDNELLKFYIDEVAPWLDVCTSQYSFGIHLPILAIKYPPLCSTIIALASCQLSVLMPSNELASSRRDERTNHASVATGLDAYSTREEAVAARTLLTICELLNCQIRDWRQPLKERADFFRSVNINGFSDGHNGSNSWVILRLDLAFSLISQTAMMSYIEDWQSPRYTFSDPQRMYASLSSTSDWTRHSILFCSAAAQLCFNPQNYDPTAIGGPRQSWTNIWTITQSWLRSLPSSMHPILTSPISTIDSSPPFSFPLILHTSRPNLLASVMHHTTCLLLLKSRPPAFRRSSQLKTPTWHAVQICGLCISNDAHWSWDPTTIAALLSAGQFISYHDQQEELLSFLTSVSRGSGWGVAGEIQEMEEMWQIDG